jgi:hypothetical protein
LIPWGADNTFTTFDEYPFASHHYLMAKIPGKLAEIPEMRQQMEAEVDWILDEVWNTEMILQSINNYENLIIEHSEYYFDNPTFPHIIEEFPRNVKIDSVEDYRKEMIELREFVMNQPLTVMEGLGPMFEMAIESPSYNDLGRELVIVDHVNPYKLLEGPVGNESGWLGNIVSKVREDMQWTSGKNREDISDMALDGSLKASIGEYIITLVYIWNDTPNFIIGSLALILLVVMKRIWRNY